MQDKTKVYNMAQEAGLSVSISFEGGSSALAGLSSAFLDWD
jgi:hypothetical protein